MKNRYYLFCEFLLVFGVIPVVLFFFRHAIAHKVVLVILLFASGCSALLLRDPGFSSRSFYGATDLSPHLKRIAATFVLPAALMTLITYMFLGHLFLWFPEQRPGVWAAMLILYPLLAAYPQEIIYRGFFFHRYRTLFPNRTAMVIVNSLCFGLAHLLYGNWVAPLLSGAGGLLFGYRYLKSRSLLIVGIEHGLWGNFLFTVGIGWFFYSGAIH